MVDAEGATGLDRGTDEPFIFFPEESVLSGMGVEPADRDARTLVAEQLHRIVAEQDGADDTVGVEFAGLAQADLSQIGHLVDCAVIVGQRQAKAGITCSLKSSKERIT